MTRPPPPVAATCNLFCLRASGGSGSRGGSGSGSGGSGAAWAPRLRRWCGRSPSPSPTHSVPAARVPAARVPAARRRPAPSPPLPPAPPRPEHPALLRRRLQRPRSSPDLWAGRERIAALGAGGAAARPPTLRGGTAAVVAGDAGPLQAAACGARAGLEEARCRRCHHRRSGPAPRSSPPSAPRPPGGAAARAPPACPPPGVRRGDGAPLPPLRGLVAGNRGALGARPRPGPALPPTSLATGGAVGPMGEGRPGGGPPAPGSRSGVPLPPGDPASGGAILSEPVPLPGLRPDCSAGKLTCAGAPLAQPEAEGR